MRSCGTFTAVPVFRVPSNSRTRHAFRVTEAPRVSGALSFVLTLSIWAEHGFCSHGRAVTSFLAYHLQRAVQVEPVWGGLIMAARVSGVDAALVYRHGSSGIHRSSLRLACGFGDPVRYAAGRVLSP